MTADNKLWRNRKERKEWPGDCDRKILDWKYFIRMRQESMRAAARADLGGLEVFRYLLRGHALLHAVQQPFCLRQCQAEFLRS